MMKKTLTGLLVAGTIFTGGLAQAFTIPTAYPGVTCKFVSTTPVVPNGTTVNLICKNGSNATWSSWEFSFLNSGGSVFSPSHVKIEKSGTCTKHPPGPSGDCTLSFTVTHVNDTEIWYPSEVKVILHAGAESYQVWSS